MTQELDLFRVVDLYDVRCLALGEVAQTLGVTIIDLMVFMDEHEIRLHRQDKPKPVVAPVEKLSKPTRRGAPRGNYDEPAMCLLYEKRWSLAEIAAEHKCSVNTVRNVIRRNGGKCRSLNEANRGCGQFGRKRVRLDDGSVTELRILRWMHGHTWVELGKRYGINHTAARLAGLGITWKHVPKPACCSKAA